MAKLVACSFLAKYWIWEFVARLYGVYGCNWNAYLPNKRECDIQCSKLFQVNTSALMAFGEGY